MLSPQFSYRPIFRRCTSLIALCALACTTGRSMDPKPAVPMIRFENATIDPVTVYVEEHGSRWLLGHVEPGRKSELRLPDYIIQKLSEVTLIVLPLGATRPGAEVVGVIRSDVEPAEHLLSMRWTLRGRQLFGETPPRRQR